MIVALWTRDSCGGWCRTSYETLRRLGIASGDGLDPSPGALAWDALARGYTGAVITTPSCTAGAVVAAWYVGDADPRSGVLAVAGRAMRGGRR